jgi:hypothetical protein
MRLALAITTALALAGCGSTQVPYTARSDTAHPQETIERVIMEQDEGNRPEFVNATDTYVEFGQGTEGTRKPFGRESSKANVTRLYYSSVTGLIYTKRNDVIVEFSNKAGSVLAEIVTGSKEDGRDLLDAMRTMQERETNPRQ